MAGDGDLDVDVVIVGAGYTGLWTALSLLEAEPAMRVVVVERHHVGFGASGRNGGWCSALLPDQPHRPRTAPRPPRRGRLAAGDDRARSTPSARFAASSAAVGHDAQFHKGGTLTVARNAAQLRRIAAAVAEARRFGFGPADVRLLGAADVAGSNLAPTRAVGAMFTPHCAAVHPLRLARAIADAATAARGAHRRGRRRRRRRDSTRLTTTAGTIRADAVVLATEAYTSQLPATGAVTCCRSTR